MHRQKIFKHKYLSLEELDYIERPKIIFEGQWREIKSVDGYNVGLSANAKTIEPTPTPTPTISVSPSLSATPEITQTTTPTYTNSPTPTV